MKSAHGVLASRPSREDTSREGLLALEGGATTPERLPWDSDDGKELMPLLTPAEVAEILQIAIQTVHENGKKLGGFYPSWDSSLAFQKGNDPADCRRSRYVVGPRTSRSSKAQPQGDGQGPAGDGVRRKSRR